LLFSIFLFLINDKVVVAYYRIESESKSKNRMKNKGFAKGKAGVFGT